MQQNKLTVKLLKQIHACNAGIDFIKRHNLIDFPIDRISEIKGDHLCYIEWLSNILVTPLEFDERGNVKKYYSQHIEFENFYDDNGNMISSVSSIGLKKEFIYNELGNIVTIDFYENEYFYDKIPKYEHYDTQKLLYDENNNLISISSCSDFTYYMFYDENNNMILDDDISYVIDYYPDGQLKQLNELIIPFFEKS